MDVPWFMLSPSPVSLLQYAVLTWIMGSYLRKTVEYKRAAWLMSLVEGFFVVALFVVAGDGIWVFCTSLKWLPLFPGDQLLLFYSMMRDVLGFTLFLLMIGHYFRNGILDFSITVQLLMILQVGLLALWFMLAPSPAYTDYVFAWRHGSSNGLIIGSWMISHWLMRIPLWIAILKTRRKTE